MFVIRETGRVIASVLGYGIRGRRLGVLISAVAVLAIIALTSAVAVSVPLVFYPFL